MIHLCLLYLVFKLSLENIENLVDGIFLKVGLVDKILTWGVEHSLGGSTTYRLESIDNPLVDFVVEAIEVNVVLIIVEVAVNVDGVTREHRGELDVKTTASNGERNLVGAQEHLGMLGFFVDADGSTLGWTNCSVDVEVRDGRVGDNSD